MSDVRQYLADAFRKRRCTLQVLKVVSARYETLENHLVDARKSIEMLTKNAQSQNDEIEKLRAEVERWKSLETERADFLARTIGNRSLEYFMVRWKGLIADNERLRAALASLGVDPGALLAVIP